MEKVKIKCKKGNLNLKIEGKAINVNEGKTVDLELNDLGYKQLLGLNNHLENLEILGSGETDAKIDKKPTEKESDGELPEKETDEPSSDESGESGQKTEEQDADSKEKAAVKKKTTKSVSKKTTKKASKKTSN